MERRSLLARMLGGLVSLPVLARQKVLTAGALPGHPPKDLRPVVVTCLGCNGKYSGTMPPRSWDFFKSFLAAHRKCRCTARGSIGFDFYFPDAACGRGLRDSAG